MIKLIIKLIYFLVANSFIHSKIEIKLKLNSYFIILFDSCIMRGFRFDLKVSSSFILFQRNNFNFKLN